MKTKLTVFAALSLGTLLVSCGEQTKEESKEPEVGIKPEITKAEEEKPNSLVLSGITPKTVVSKAFDGIAVVSEGGEFKKTQVKNAKQYILYFSASW